MVKLANCCARSTINLRNITCDRIITYEYLLRSMLLR